MRRVKRLSSWTLLALALGLALPAGIAASGQEAPPPAAIFFQPDFADWKAILPPPPAADSIAALADLETVLQVQAVRTPADAAWAKLIVKDDYFADYGDVIGPWFEEKNLPVIADFLRQIKADTQAVNWRVKDLYSRRRPPVVEPAVQPCVELPKSNSYPSGHSLRAFVMAAVLGDIFPERQAELEARAHRVAWGRILGGVHFPTDVAGSRLVAEMIVAQLRKSREYRAAVEQCRAEAVPFRLKQAA